MILTNKDETKVIIECDCGCKAITFSKLEDEDYEEYIIGTEVNAFYSEQDGVFDKLIKRIKLAWHILTRGTHVLYEVCITKKDMQELRDVINKIIK